MEKKEECILVKELLPIYCDEAVSDEGKAIIEKHLETCEDCNTYKEELSQMKLEEQLSEQKLEETQTEHAAKVSEKLRKHKKRVDLISTTAFVILWLAFMCCFQVVEVSGSSMEPNFHNGDRLLMNRIVYHVTEPKRGDVVSVGLEDMTILKRIVGLPGETVEIKDNAIYIDGEKITMKEQDGVIKPGERDYPITLGEDEYFVMGDNVRVSLDSRYEEVGTITKDEIHNKLTCRFFKI